jgi:hypothetical protein
MIFDQAIYGPAITAYMFTAVGIMNGNSRAGIVQTLRQL